MCHQTKRREHSCPRRRLDKFYTKPSAVARCMAALDDALKQIPRAHDCVIDPSSGAGAFYNAVRHPRKIALDIAPEHPEALKADWLRYETDSRIRSALVVGNPPFGRYHSLSSQFIRRATSLANVATVAFVLPDVYRKRSRQRVLPAGWRIVSVAALGENAFTLGGRDFHIPSSFFIFDKSPGPDLRAPAPPSETRDFAFGTRDDYDCFVFGAAPRKVVRSAKPNNRGHFLKAKIPVERLMDRIRRMEWRGNSCATGGVFWLAKGELAEQYAACYSRPARGDSVPLAKKSLEA